MNLKKYKGLLIAGGVVLVLLAVAGFLLYSSMSRYAQGKTDLQAEMQKLSQLNNREPFPSQTNIAQVTTNLLIQAGVLKEMNEQLREGQVEPQQMESAEFGLLLENGLRAIRASFATNGIILPQRMSFGFDRYAGGQPPRDLDIPRLVQQLRIIDNLCKILVAAGIAELQVISREEFETMAGAAPPRPGQPPSADKVGTIGPNELYGKMRFKLVFRAKESAVLEVLNALAAHEMFTVITVLEKANQKQGLRDVAFSPAVAPAAPPGGAAAGGAIPREQRVVIGREEVDVKMEVDVYRFAPIPDQPARER
ncbi:MAG: hypothetical protein HY343_09070 [Lentisphaerae bacterium]|nr:hypothetical protein [Lentisphaerota bacterium]